MCYEELKLFIIDDIPMNFITKKELNKENKMKNKVKLWI